LPGLLWVSALRSDRKFQYFGRTSGSVGCLSTNPNWNQSTWRWGSMFHQTIGTPSHYTMQKPKRRPAADERLPC